MTQPTYTINQILNDRDHFQGFMPRNTVKSPEQFIFQCDISSQLSKYKKDVKKVVAMILNDPMDFTVFDRILESKLVTPTSNASLHILQRQQLLERIYFRTIKLLHSPFGKQPEIKRNEIGAESSVDIGVQVIGINAHDNKVRNDIKYVKKQLVCTDDTIFNEYCRALYAYNNHELPIFSRQILLRYLVGKTTEMFQYTKEHSFFIHGRRNIAYNFLVAVLAHLNEEFAFVSQQKVQIIEFCGKSGIGKSQAVMNMKYLFKAICPALPMRDIVYSRANDYWWNGYCGQPIVLYDDFTHVNKKKLKFDLAFELVAVASGTLRNPPMAFAKNMEFTSILACVTSNIPLVTTIGSVDTINAIKRRLVSEPWDVRDGMAVEKDGYYEYTFDGVIISNIRSRSNCSLIGMFNLVRNIIYSGAQYDVTVKQEQHHEYQDVYYLLNIGSNTYQPLLTSSVPRSLSVVSSIEQAEVLSNHSTVGDCSSENIVSEELYPEAQVTYQRNAFGYNLA